MHFSNAVVLFAAGSSAFPVWNILAPKDVVYQTVTDVNVVYQTVTAGAEPATSTTEAAAENTQATGGSGDHGDHHWNWWNGYQGQNQQTTSAAPAPVPTTSTSEAPPPAPTTTTSEAPPPPSTTSAPPPPPQTESTTQAETTAAPTSSATVSSGNSPTSDGVSMIDVINKWRSKNNKSSLKWNDQLASNAKKTGTDDGGVNQIHQLNANSYAQVITPGFDKNPDNYDMGGVCPFELSYIAWLCEDPFNGLSTGCALVKNILNMQYDGTGHSDILNDDDYKTIGCAFSHNPNAASDSPYQGLWVCDLGF